VEPGVSSIGGTGAVSAPANAAASVSPVTVPLRTSAEPGLDAAPVAAPRGLSVEPGVVMPTPTAMGPTGMAATASVSASTTHDQAYDYDYEAPMGSMGSQHQHQHQHQQELEEADELADAARASLKPTTTRRYRS